VSSPPAEPPEPPPEVILVAALDRTRVIGARGGIPWHLPDDLRRFKALTTGHPVVMGRATFESIGRPLPGRTNVVLTRDPRWTADGVVTAADLPTALEVAGAAPGGEVVFVIGGGAIYGEALAFAHRLELTHVDTEVEGDTWFPPIDPDQWEVRAGERHEPDDAHTVAFEFVTYVRR
jgi:dihydrofolate reductase